MNPIKTAYDPQVADNLISGASSHQQQSANAGKAVQPRASHLSSEKNSTPVVNRVIQWLSDGASRIKNSWMQFQFRRTCEAFIKKVPSWNDVCGELKIWDAKKILEKEIAGCVDRGAPGEYELILKTLSQCLRSCGDEKLFRIIGILSDKNSSDIYFNKLNEERLGLTNIAVTVAAERFGVLISNELTSFKEIHTSNEVAGRYPSFLTEERKIDVGREFSSYFEFARLVNQLRAADAECLRSAVIEVIGEELKQFSFEDHALFELQNTLKSYRFAITHPKGDREIVEKICDNEKTADPKHFYALLLKKFDDQYGESNMLSAPDYSDSDSDPMYYSCSDVAYGQIYE